MPLPPGYVEVPRNYAGIPTMPGYKVGWQYENPIPPPPMASKSTSVRATAGSHGSKSVSDEIFEAKTKESWQYAYYEGSQPAPAAAPPEPAQAPTPVLLCHTCDTCGRTRSAGFHRSNPVIPGHNTIKSTCRRCKKKQRKCESSMRKVTHVRKCVATEPCDWPEKSVRIEIDKNERRGRHRHRAQEEQVQVRHHSTSRPRVVTRKESRHGFGLRTLQLSCSPPRVMRRKVQVRNSSPSPIHERVRVRYVSDLGEDAPPPPPPPLQYMPPHPEEPLPLPPIRSRARSISPIRYQERQEHYSRQAQYRLAEHPVAYRSVYPDQRGFVEELEDDYPPTPPPARNARIAQSPSRGILKPSNMTRETEYRRRMSMHESQESTRVEVGGPRVQFVRSSRGTQPSSLSDDESDHVRVRVSQGILNNQQSSSDGMEFYRQRAGAAAVYLDDPSPPRRRPASPPSRAFEELCIRHVSPLPLNPRRGGAPVLRADGLPRTQSEERRALDFEYRHVRRRSPSPPSRPSERVAFSYHRARSPDPPSPSGRLSYRTIPRPALPERESERPMLMQRGNDWDELTASGSDEGETVSVRTWRERDENGEMATFVEERTTRALPREGSRRLAELAVAGSWRDV